jgi:hypothetical protein
MPESVYDYLASDHDRLDGILKRASAGTGVIGGDAYGEFRKGLLRHIAMEEKVLFPALVRLQGGTPLAIVERLHLDHGALVALLVPPPSNVIVATIRSILSVHNAVEEQADGVYRMLERLAGPEAEDVLKALRAIPPVPVQPHNELPDVLNATRRAVERAGYTFAEVPEEGNTSAAGK